MELVLTLLCMYGVMFTLKCAQLPGLVQVREFAMMHSTFMNKMLSCSFCTGFHAGWITYLLMKGSFALSPMIVFGLASATFCYVLDTLMLKLEG